MAAVACRGAAAAAAPAGRRLGVSDGCAVGGLRLLRVLWQVLRVLRVLRRCGAYGQAGASSCRGRLLWVIT